MLEHYYREFIEFHNREGRLIYQYSSGQQADYPWPELYNRYADLFTLDVIDRFKQDLAETDPYYEAKTTRLKRLIKFASQHYLTISQRTLTSEIAQAEARSQVEWQGKIISLSQVEELLGVEPDALKRAELQRKKLNNLAAINDLRAERIEKLSEHTTKLGYQNYLEMQSQLKNIDYAQLDSQMQQLLAHTEKIYKINISNSLRLNCQLSLTNTHSGDINYFLRQKPKLQNFTASRMINAYRETLRRLGIYLGRQPQLTIDLTERTHKQKQPLAVALSIPDDIRLSVHPEHMAGWYNYYHFFHQAAQAQHWAFTSATLDPVFKYVPDKALAECYGRLFRSLTSDPHWLAQILEERESTELGLEAILMKLYLVRRNAAKLHYEIDLYTKSISSAANNYVECLTSATLINTSATEYLADWETQLQVADYLRGEILATLLREYLLTRYGYCWWRERKAGELLKELWHTGNFYTADEVAAQLSLGRLTPEILEIEFLTKLKA